MKKLKKIIRKYLNKKQLPRIIAILGGAIVGFALGNFFGAILGIVTGFFLEELLAKSIKRNCVRR